MCVCVRACVYVCVCVWGGGVVMGIAFNGENQKSVNYQAGTKDSKKLKVDICS